MSKRSTDARTREAARADIPEIIVVTTSSISEGEDEGFGGPSVDSPFRSVEKLSSVWKDSNRMGTEELLVAEAAGHVVGVVAVEDRGSELELVDIDVAKKDQGKGIGTLLVEFVEQTGRTRRKVAVTLGTSRNAEGVPWKALPWWLSRGYDTTHEEENAWTRSIGPGAREIRMRKSL